MIFKGRKHLYATVKINLAWLEMICHKVVPYDVLLMSFQGEVGMVMEGNVRG